MFANLDIPKAYGGYDFDVGDCYIHAFAAAASHFGDEYYYLMYFYNTIYFVLIEEEVKTFREEFLYNKMGLNLIYSEANNFIEFKTKLIYALDNNKPALMIIPYDFKIYAPIKNENEEGINPSNHPIIINGYSIDSLGEYLYAKESLQQDEGIIKKHIPFMPLVSIKGSFEAFYNMFEGFNKGWKSRYKGILFFSDKVTDENSLLELYTTACFDFLNINIPSLKYLSLFEYFSENASDTYKFVRYVRQTLINYYTSLYDIFSFIADYCPEKVKNNFIIFRDKNIFERNILANKIIRLMYKDTIELQRRMDDYKKELIKLDLELQTIVRIIVDEVKNNYIKPSLINYALSANLLADSEEEHKETHEIMKVSRLIDGNHTNQITDAWISTADERTHWILADLIEKRKIEKVILYHEPLGFIAIRAYTVSYSLNGEEWVVADIIEDDVPIVAEHHLGCVECRYIRIDILIPSLADRHARLYGMEIWGR